MDASIRSTSLVRSAPYQQYLASGESLDFVASCLNRTKEFSHGKMMSWNHHHLGSSSLRRHGFFL